MLASWAYLRVPRADEVLDFKEYKSVIDALYKREQEEEEDGCPS